MFNKICIQGNLVRTPEFADTKDTDILNFTIASTRKYKQKEETVFVDCTAYGATAENIAKFFDKGDPVGVEGRLCLNQWEDHDGNKRSKIYITVDAFHFVGQTGGGDKEQDNSRGNSRQSSRGGGRGRSSGRGQSRGRNSGGDARQSNRARQGGRNERQEDNRYDDNVPF